MTKEDKWTIPERLNTQININEIEQRPFVTADNRFLFFIRMSIAHEDGEDIYGSDIYWVNTRTIFGPYSYNTALEAPVKYNEEFQLNFPKDVFKDVDDNELIFHLAMNDDSEIPDWLEFDKSLLALHGIWRFEEAKTFKLTATDPKGNTGKFEFRLGQ